LINKMTSAASSRFMCGWTLAELVMAELMTVGLVSLLLGFA
jgi:hypothetical protein